MHETIWLVLGAAVVAVALILLTWLVQLIRHLTKRRKDKSK